MSKPTVSFEEFAKLDLRVGRVRKAAPLEGSDKLIRLSVDFVGEQRTILVGLKKWYRPQEFEGKKFVFVLNLEPKRMAGEESQGMLLAADSKVPKPLEAPEGTKEGEIIR